jgi:hypothetical protein
MAARISGQSARNWPAFVPGFFPAPLCEAVSSFDDPLPFCLGKFLAFFHAISSLHCLSTFFNEVRHFSTPQTSSKSQQTWVVDIKADVVVVFCLYRCDSAPLEPSANSKGMSAARRTLIVLLLRKQFRPGVPLPLPL